MYQVQSDIFLFLSDSLLLLSCLWSLTQHPLLLFPALQISFLVLLKLLPRMFVLSAYPSIYGYGLLGFILLQL